MAAPAAIAIIRQLARQSTERSIQRISLATGIDLVPYPFPIKHRELAQARRDESFAAFFKALADRVDPKGANEPDPAGEVTPEPPSPDELQEAEEAAAVVGTAPLSEDLA